MNPLTTLNYLSAMWTLTTALFAGRVSEEIARAAYVNMMMLDMLVGEFVERPCATVYQISDWRTA